MWQRRVLDFYTQMTTMKNDNIINNNNSLPPSPSSIVVSEQEQQAELPPHIASLTQLYERYNSTIDGLSSLEDVLKRQTKHGPNELRVTSDIPIYLRFLRQFKNFFALLLIFGGTLAIIAETLDPQQGNLYITIALFGVVLLNAIFSFIQEEQSERIMDSFRKMLPSMVRVRREGVVSQIEARELVPGDVILLFEGDKVPADGRLISSHGLKVDLSSLTGESEPVLLNAHNNDNSHDDDDDDNINNKNKTIIQSRHMVFSGSLITAGDGEALVCHTGMTTQIGTIVQLTKETETVITPIGRELRYFIKVISIIAIVLGVTFFIISVALGKGAMGSLIFAIGIIVANVPEGLLPTVTLALTMASKRIAKKNALVKNLESVETLGSTNVICTDKTGTLTQNKISVHRIVTVDDTFSFGVLDGSSDENDDNEEQRRRRHQRRKALVILCRIMGLCNNATWHSDDDGAVTNSSSSNGSSEHVTNDDKNDNGRFVGDSTEVALLSCVKDINEQWSSNNNDEGTDNDYDHGKTTTAAAIFDPSLFPRTNEIPFSSESKFMITLNQSHPSAKVVTNDEEHQQTTSTTAASSDLTTTAYLKGAPEVIFQFCNRIITSNDGCISPINDKMERWFDDTLNRMASTGERCLGLAYRPDIAFLDDKSDNITQNDRSNDNDNNDDYDIPTNGFIFVGIVGLLDPPRPEVPEALRKCQRAGIRVFMLTGDYGLTARTIARDIGLFSSSTENDTDDDDDTSTADQLEKGHYHPPKNLVIEGSELSSLTPSQLSSLISSHQSLVFARISPLQKLQIVKALQNDEAHPQVVTVTGDGVNDAPALKNADMGVAMGIMGTDVAKEAADMILMDDDFATIVAAVEEGRVIFENIKKFVAYVLTSNVPEITPFIAYVLFGIPLSLTVVLILAIDLGTDIVPSLGLGAEVAEVDVMARPPRDRSERLLTRNMLGMSYGIVGMTQALAGFCSYFVVLGMNGWTYGEQLEADDVVYRTAITAFFSSIIICQVADVLICRTRRQSIFTVGLFSNKLIFVGIGTELLLLFLISYVPVCNTFFGTAPLEWWHVMLSVPFAVAILIGDEIRRFFVRKENKFVLKWLTW